MSVCARISKAILVAAGFAVAAAGPACAGDPARPARVVSVNLCTDQLAMLIAAPDQLKSVSYVAADPSVSLMADEARKVGVNHAGAEEIYLLRPDLVLAGRYSASESVAMLRRLGVRVEIVEAAESIDQLRTGIVQMGGLLQREARAAEVLAGFDAAMAAISPNSESGARIAATYGASGVTASAGTLAGDAMRRAGLILLADRIALPPGGTIALETLVMQAPDLIVTGTRQDGQSNAQAVLDHPALAAMNASRVQVPDRDWICGLPAIAGAVKRLSE